MMAPVYDALAQKYWRSFVFLKTDADSSVGGPLQLLPANDLTLDTPCGKVSAPFTWQLMH